MFRDRFWLSLALSVPVLLFSEMLQDLARVQPRRRSRATSWIPPILGTAVFLYGG